jgi:hypothetical protein
MKTSTPYSSAVWTYTLKTAQVEVEREEPEDKVIRYSGQYDPGIGHRQQGVINLRVQDKFKS